MKIIASDFDGTLNFGGITKDKIEAIEKWREKGNLFVLVTGRGAEDALNIRNDNPFPCDYILAQNGSVIMNNCGDVLTHKICERNVVKPFLEYIFGLGCPWGCVHFDKDFFYVYDDEVSAKENDGYTLENIPEVPFITQINTALTCFSEAERVTESILEAFGNLLNPLQNVRCIDIVPAGMDKAKGIYMLLNMVGGKKKDVITVGDNLNDAHMIREFYSYAMENGVEYIKEISDCRTTSVSEMIYKEMLK